MSKKQNKIIQKKNINQKISNKYLKKKFKKNVKNKISHKKFSIFPQ